MSRYMLIFFAFGFVSCSPMYDTVYDFTPPTSDTGRVCVENCDETRVNCETLETDRHLACEDQERARMERCAEHIEAQKHRPPNGSECGRITTCSSDSDRCDSMYRSCFKSCGGTVIEKKECVAFCPEK